MRPIGQLSLAALTAFALGSVLLTPARAENADEKAIEKIERDMDVAPNVDQLMSSWDKDVVFHDIYPGEVVGYKNVHDDLAKQFAASESFKVNILRMKVKADGKVGFAYSTQRFQAKLKGGKPPLDMVFRQTDCYEKKNGKWKLVYQHLSLPMDPATGKMVTDSK